MRLDPPELGHVQIRIDRPLDAPARVEITVERTETLTLLLRDQPQLQRALDQAGVPPDGRSVTFHVATSEAGQRSDGAPTSNPGTASSGLAGDGSHGASRQGGSPTRHGNPDDTETEFVQIALPGWVRGGIDITA
jgi:flagellar hook-length control protein FliK